MKVVIVAKTRMGSGACVGALTFDGCSLRLVAHDRAYNDQFNMEYQIGEVWDVESRPDPEIIPPHVENVIVTHKRRLGPISSIEAFIEKHMPPASGNIDQIFDGLTQNTKAGALYISEWSGIPDRSTMFWIPDQPLQRVDDLKRIRYRYPGPRMNSKATPTLTFTGFQEPVAEIPAGTLLRISLAHWWRPDELLDAEYRCYVQLSGWFSEKPGLHQALQVPHQAEKNTIETEIPKIQSILKQTFGYAAFRPLQEKIIANVMRKNDTLAIMPTGSGKSLCYQLPATLFSGLTVVVSPLIALMENQVLELSALGIPAVFLNSTLSHSAYVDTTAQIRAGEIKLLYAAPETLLRPETTVLLSSCPVDCLVIDEAHCISEWGHDFRPEYRQLAGLRNRLPDAVTLAVTATATGRVREDIKASLGITDANEFISSFNRENLVLNVTDKVDGLAQTRAFLDTHRGEAGIIYCATRDQVNVLTTELGSLDYPVLPYHAGMDDDVRRANQHRFHYEDNLIMVATIAFGMGVNKSNLRFILHYDLPKNIESYYQQIGRAGRDGLPAECLLLYSYKDVNTIRYFIKQKPPELRRGAEMRLNALLSFLETRICRRIPLLDYFGESFPDENCEVCDNCLHPDHGQSAYTAVEHQKAPGKESEKVDLSALARLFITCALDTGERFGVSHLIRVLRGSKAQKVLKFKHDKVPSYGAGSAYSEACWRNLAGQFIRLGLLKRVQPHGSVKVTQAGREVLEGRKVWGTLPGEFVRTARKEMPAHDPVLFERLRELRTRLANERNLPSYVIFHDRTLIELAIYLPRTRREFGNIHGIGARKIEAYGPHFLPVIRAYCQENDVHPVRQVQQPILTHTRLRGKERTDYVWEHFQAGETISAIAADLGYSENTILNHLHKAFEAGRPLNTDGLYQANQLSPEEEQQVIEAFEECGSEILKPIYLRLNETVPYSQLHLWRMIYKARLKSN